MPAPDLDTIYDIETALEASSVAVLTAQGFDPAILCPTRSTITPRPTARVDIVAQLGQATRRGYLPPDAPANAVTRDAWEDAWRFTLIFSVVTERDKTAQSHGPFRGKLRRILSQYARLFTAAVLPYHEIVQWTGSGTANGQIDGQKNEDISQLRLEGIVAVRPNAWPALT